MKPLVLQLSNPRVMAALRDFRTMQRWEVLRRSQRAMSAQEFAAACETAYERAAASLDLLLEGGFVTRTKASARRRHTTYSSAAETILVEFDPTNAEQRQWINDSRREIRQYSRDAVDSRGQSPSAGTKKQYLEFFRTPAMTQADVARVVEVLERAFDVIMQIEREARARAIENSAAGSTATPPSDGAAADEADTPTQYIAAMQFKPVGAGVLPLPNITLIDRGLAPRRIKVLASNPRALLTQRELQIAERLAQGESRPEAAKVLGVSVNTVASMTKRIYAKLGVTNRAEFTSRMSSIASH